MILGFTGHRKGPGIVEYNLKNVFRKILTKAKPSKLISGMSWGSDMWIAEVCVELGIPYIAAIPYDGHTLKWDLDLQVRYLTLLESAASSTVVCPEYSKAAYHKRNQWIVNNCDVLLAVCSDLTANSGAKSTIDYAKMRMVPVTVFDPSKSKRC